MWILEDCAFCAYPELLLFRKMAESTSPRKSPVPRDEIRNILVEHVRRELNAALSGEYNPSSSLAWTIKAIADLDRATMLEIEKEKRRILMLLEEAAMMEDEAQKLMEEVREEEAEIARMRNEMAADNEEDDDYKCDENCLMCKAWGD